MSEHIYTIPINDAINENCECVLCTLEKKLEDEAVDYFLGPSMMEPDGREITNERGFCRRHLSSLYERGNRLSFALMLDTHMSEVRARVGRKCHAPHSGAINKSAAKKSVEKVCGEIDAILASCALCDKLDSQMKNAAANFVWMWGDDREFRDKFAASRGLCLPHMKLVLEASLRELGGKKLDEFLAAVYKVQQSTMEELNSDLNWFTQKYDYKNQDAPWGNSKDALPRTVRRLGKF